MYLGYFCTCIIYSQSEPEPLIFKSVPAFSSTRKIRLIHAMQSIKSFVYRMEGNLETNLETVFKVKFHCLTFLSTHTLSSRLANLKKGLIKEF